MASQDSYSPCSGEDSLRERKRDSYDMPDSGTVLSSDFSSEESQTSSVLGRLIEYVFSFMRNNFCLVPFSKLMIVRVICIALKLLLFKNVTCVSVCVPLSGVTLHF